MGGRGVDDERFSARLNEADAMFTAVSDAGGVPYAPVGFSVMDKDFDDPDIRPYFRERRARLLPAVRRRIVRDRFSIALPRWVEVPDFEPSDNALMLPAPGDGSIRAILDWAAAWSARPFATDRPPWRTVIFTGVTYEGRTGCVVLLGQQHHAIIDGEGSRRMHERQQPIVPGQPLPPLPPPVAYDTSTAFERWREGWALEAAKAREGLRNTAARVRWAAANPAAGAKRARELAGAVRRMAKQQGSTTRSPLLRRRSDDLRFDWITCDLAQLKAGGKAVGGTLNDAFLAAVAVGLQGYHRDHGVVIGSLRAAVAVNTRTAEQGHQGNRVTGVVLDLPLSADAATAVKACGEVSRANVRDDDLIWITDRFRALANRLPRRLVVPMTRRTMSAFDLQLSNTMGPPETITNAGVTTLATCPLPVSGQMGLSITLTSYAGVASIGIVSDRQSIPDPEHLARRLEEGCAAVIALAA